MRKKIIVGILILAVGIGSLGITIPQAQTAQRVYKSLDAVEIAGRTIMVASNSQGMETFQITANRIKKLGEAQAVITGETAGLYARQEKDGFYAYVAAGKELHKYNIKSAEWPSLNKSIKTDYTLYDISGRPDVSTILVAGESGVQEFETGNLGLVRKIVNAPSYGVYATSDRRSIVATRDNTIVFDAHFRPQFGDEITIDIRQTGANKPYGDNHKRSYVMTNSALKKVGTQLEFPNQSGYGYSVAGLDDYEYIFASNGQGVYKFNKALVMENYNALGKNGAWCRGLKVVKIQDKIRVLVAADDRIYLTDENLNVLDVYSYEAPKNLRPGPSFGTSPQDIKIAAKKSIPGLALQVRTNTAQARALDKITVYASGYWPGEPLTIEAGPYTSSFANLPDARNKTDRTLADAYGNAIAYNIRLPEYKTYPKTINVRVIGKNSKLSYATTMKVLEPAKKPEEELEYKKPEITAEYVKEIERTTETTTENGVVKEIIKETERIIEKKVVSLEIRDGKIELNALQIPQDVYIRFVNLDRGKNYQIKSIKTPKQEEFESDKIEPEHSYEVKLTKQGKYEYVLYYRYGNQTTERMRGKILVK